MLTKSDLLSLFQCHRKLWLEHNRPKSVPKQGVAQSRRAMEGVAVGELSRTLLGSQIVQPRSANEDRASAAIHARKQLLIANGPPLAEFPVVYRDLYARFDALIPRSNGYLLQETKATLFPLKKDKTPAPADQHQILDVAIQQWLMEGSEIPVAGVELNLLDATWRYLGNGDYSGLFCRMDVTNDSEDQKRTVPELLSLAQVTLGGPMPSVATGRHCDHPHECEFHAFCLTLDPPRAEHPIDLLPDGAGKALAKKLRETKGYTSILEPSSEDLAGKNDALYLRVQAAHRTGKPILDRAGAAPLLALPYPRYFFDFEGIDFAVPRWVGLRPYEHVPFQWSCHIETAPGEFEHAEFLDLTGADPSLACIEELRQVINPYDTSPLIVYNAGYERALLDGLATRHPEHSEILDRYIARLFDLLPVVKDSFYDQAMRGSFSIKAVLPAIRPEMDYSELDEVQDGGGAQLAYLMATSDPPISSARRVDLERKLRRYCRQDTWAMVELAHFLVENPRPNRPDTI